MDRAPDFRIGVRPQGAAIVVAPEGDVDLETADALRDELQLALSRAGHVIVDLRGVTFMDSSGLRLLVEITREADRVAGELSVVRGPRAVQRLFEVSGLLGRLRLIDDPAEAEGGAGAGAG